MCLEQRLRASLLILGGGSIPGGKDGQCKGSGAGTGLAYLTNSKEPGVARWTECREGDLGGPCSHSEAFDFDSL